MKTIHIANNHDKKLPMDNNDAVRQLADKVCPRLQQSLIRDTIFRQQPKPSSP